MNDIFDGIPDGVKLLLDVLSITAMLGALTEMLPHIAALLTIAWTGIRIYETETVQRWLGKRP